MNKHMDTVKPSYGENDFVTEEEILFQYRGYNIGLSKSPTSRVPLSIRNPEGYEIALAYTVQEAHNIIDKYFRQ